MKCWARLAVTTFAVGLAPIFATPSRAEINYTRLVGGPGGGYLEDSCHPDDILVGFNFTGDKAFNTIAAVCIAVRNGAWVGNDYGLATHGRLPVHGNGIGVVRCPRNQFVWAFHAFWGRDGIVHNVDVSCRDLSEKANSTVRAGVTGGQAVADGVAPCDRGFLGIGMISMTGTLVDSIGLKCQARAP